MTTKQLQKLCAKWQKRLRLQDWKIEVSFVHAGDMRGPSSAGEVSFFPDHAFAQIQILPPEELDSGNPMHPSIEQVLVHELLHLHMGTFAAKGKAADMAQDRAIECLVPALLASSKGLG